jgi:hypothetical protein
MSLRMLSWSLRAYNLRGNPDPTSTTSSIRRPSSFSPRESLATFCDEIRPRNSCRCVFRATPSDHVYKAVIRCRRALIFSRGRPTTVANRRRRDFGTAWWRRAVTRRLGGLSRRPLIDISLLSHRGANSSPNPRPKTFGDRY